MFRRTTANIPKTPVPWGRAYRNWYGPPLLPPPLPLYNDPFLPLPLGFHEPFAPREFDVDWFGNKSMNEYFETREEKDKHVVSIKDEKLDEKNVNIDFNKNDNSLQISIQQSINQEEKGKTSSFSSSFSSNYQFEKPVDVAGILADHGQDVLTITVPKLQVEKDDDVVNIKINKSGKGKPQSEATKPET
ncbi:Small heat shock protein 21 [Spathaspora sp. JA1]|nr:Small heat shock protein 21 [Spathaspora sp. JA1]